VSDNKKLSETDEEIQLEANSWPEFAQDISYKFTQEDVVELIDCLCARIDEGSRCKLRPVLLKHMRLDEPAKLDTISTAKKSPGPLDKPTVLIDGNIVDLNGKVTDAIIFESVGIKAENLEFPFNKVEEKPEHTTEITLKSIQVKSVHNARVLIKSLSMIEEVCGIHVAKITIDDLFWCPWIDNTVLTDTHMGEVLIEIVEQIESAKEAMDD
jgi:hypothetical protein